MNDQTLRKTVKKELEWDPTLDATRIAVGVTEGAVTLAGYVSTYSEESAALRAAGRVYGVMAVADELEVKPTASSAQQDPIVARAISGLLRWNESVPDTVHAEVRHGWVTLRGDAEWSYQRRAAERSVRDVEGIRGVDNFIAVVPEVKASGIKKRVIDALKRIADLNACSIRVTTDNGTVHLDGRVHSRYERLAAENAAAAAPGVSRVDNRLRVSP